MSEECAILFSPVYFQKGKREGKIDIWVGEVHIFGYITNGTQFDKKNY